MLRYEAKVCGRPSTVFYKWVNETLADSEYFEFDYKQGKGHFKVDTAMLITNFNQTEFKKVIGMIETNENPQVLAGYLNSLIKKVYDRFNAELKDTDPDRKVISDFLSKRNEFLVKAFGVSSLQEVQEEQEAPVEANVLMTALKKCNVNRLIPTQIKPTLQGTIETKVGYHFEYRGLPLQVFRVDGWETKASKPCRIFVIDPVIGLPVTQYDGMLSDLEETLSQVFIKYLQTIEGNKEAIVQFARLFKTIKGQVA